MQTYNPAGKNLAKILAASDRTHKAEMRALLAEIARLKRAYTKSHGGPPHAHTFRRMAT